MEDQEHRRSPSRAVAGRAVAVGMVAFAVVMVGAMWLYLELYTRPFRPLQTAIDAEFPKSSPRIVGGRHKSHKPDSPASLRILIRVDFNPREDELRSLATAGRLVQLAGRHLDVAAYDDVDVHLEQRIPERESIRWSISRPVREWDVLGEDR